MPDLSLLIQMLAVLAVIGALNFFWLAYRA